MTKTFMRPLPALVAAILAPGVAHAIDFASGGWNGSFDTTVSFGQTWREQARDPRLIGTADGGTGRSPNIDDGDLNYRKGRVSSAYKIVAELSLDHDNYGLFVRGSALYDALVEDAKTDRTPISESGKNLAGSYVRLLDAFVYGRWDLAGHQLDIRAGNQVVNWGESTFIQGGINNAINHFDVTALRVPGSELREAYLPQEVLKVSFGLTDNLTAEAIGIFGWDRTEPEPVGSYFSSNDFVPRGGEEVFLGFGAFSDQGTDFRPLGGPFIENFQGVPRASTIEASDSGQYGLSLRWFMPDFAQGTELGFYYVNYHSKLPLISGQTGTQAGICKSLGALNAAGAAARGLASGLPFGAAVAIGASVGSSRSQGVNAAVPGSVNCTGNADPLTPESAAEYATISANTVLGGGSVASQAPLSRPTSTRRRRATSLNTLRISSFSASHSTPSSAPPASRCRARCPTARMYRCSSTTWKYSLRPSRLSKPPQLAEQGGVVSTTCASPGTLAGCGQLGPYGVDQVVKGWDLFDVWQGQVTATKAFPPMLGAAQLVAVVEAGMTKVDGMPSMTSGGPNGRGIRFNAPGTSVSGNEELAARHFGEFEPLSAFADATSWGYRAALRLDYLGLIGAWNFSPRFVWSHDVDGTTPGPGGNFVEGRQGVTLGILASYQSQLEFDMSYTTFGGAGRYNDLTDRDFLSATIKYSF